MQSAAIHLSSGERAAGVPNPSGNGPPCGPWSSMTCAVLVFLVWLVFLRAHHCVPVAVCSHCSAHPFKQFAK